MLLHIIGSGIVGSATGDAFQRFNHDIIYSDIEITAPDIGKADFHFVCVPETAVEEVIGSPRFSEMHDNNAPILIRSTVPPTTTQELATKYRKPFWHNPEFLREVTAEDDILHSTYTVIGSAQPDKTKPPVLFEGYEQLYGALQIEPILCSATESELVKLITNAYLSTQIGFWNEIKRITDIFGINSHSVARTVARDTRISKYGAYRHGEAFGGKCLPKDLEQLINVSPITDGILNTVQMYNQELDNVLSGKWTDLID
jgi:UDPglucose 6-dehydrogenase